MAKDLELDLNTMDLRFPPRFITGKAELMQSLIIRLMTPKGTMEGYPNVGLDTSYLNKGFNLDELRLAIVQCLKQDRRVNNVKSIQIKPDASSHTINVAIDVSTTLGEINMTKEMKSNAIN